MINVEILRVINLAEHRYVCIDLVDANYKCCVA